MSSGIRGNWQERGETGDKSPSKRKATRNPPTRGKFQKNKGPSEFQSNKEIFGEKTFGLAWEKKKGKEQS